MKYTISNLSLLAKFLIFGFTRNCIGAIKNTMGILLTLIFIFSCSNQLEEDIIDTQSSAREVNISRFFLVDANTNLDISWITDGLVIEQADINIRVGSNAASVLFELSGAETLRRIENDKPFTLAGDSDGNYFKWRPGIGTYSLTVTPYPNKDGTGQPGTSKTINFIVKARDPIAFSNELLFQINWSQHTISPITNGYSISNLSLPSSIRYIRLNNFGREAYVKHEIISYDNQKVLKGILFDDDPNTSGTSRAQMTVRLNQDMKKIHTRHRMWLNPDIKFLETHPDKINWLSLYEMWNERDDNMTGNPSGSARWTLSLNKNNGADNKLYWAFDGEYHQPKEIKHQDIISKITNKNIPIPFGKWFTLEMYLERDNVNGRILWSIQEDGGEKKVLFDYTGCTIYPDREDLQLTYLQAYKFYTADKFMDYMRNNGKEFSVMYSDFNMLK